MNVGRIAAYLNDKDQAELLNEMGKYLAVFCKEACKEDWQFCAIAEGLDGHGKRLIRSLADFVRLRDEADARGRK